MLRLGKKLNNIGRTKLVIGAGVLLVLFSSGAVAYGLIVRSNTSENHQKVENHNGSVTTNERVALSKDRPVNKPSSEIKKTSELSRADTPKSAQTDAHQQPSRVATESPELILPADEDYTLVTSSSSVKLGTSEAYPLSAVVTIRYRSGKNIEFLQVAKQPRFEVSSAIYLGSIFVGEASAGTDAVGSRKLLISQLAPDASAVSGIVYVTTNPNSPPVAVHISWNPAN